MNSLLSLLDQQLKNARADFYLQLNTPLAAKEIQKMEDRFGIILPEEVKSLYFWKNGQAGNCSESFVNNSMFMPLEEALETAASMTSMIGFDFETENWWNKNWIPLFHNGGGDYICYDTGGTFTGVCGQLIEFWHADNDRNVIAPDLLSFMAMLTRYYQTHSPENIDEYILLEKIPGYPKKFLV